MSNFEQDLKKVLLEQRIKDAQRAKIIQEALKPLEEDVAETSEEQIDEISKNTLGSYVKKANQNSNDMSDLRGSVGTDSPRYSKLNKIVKKREKGIKTAVDKLTKEDLEFLETMEKTISEE